MSEFNRLIAAGTAEASDKLATKLAVDQQEIGQLHLFLFDKHV
jgi:hypothetical protein